MNNLVAEVAKNWFLSCVEPNPISFSGVDEDDVERVCIGIEKATGEVGGRFNRGAVNRRAFLAGCLDATEGELREHLIVGYGVKYGNTTKVQRLHHVRGDEHSVLPTRIVMSAIEHHIVGASKGEILIFHNHPNWFLNVVTDNLPLASSTDRATAARVKFNPFQFLKNFFGNGDVKFYVGENGFVREFVLPPFDQLADLYRASQRLSVRSNGSIH